MLVPLISNAQSSIQFHQIGINDGLTDLTVNSIAQDSLGILYFGTENGLSIYDGRSFENYYADQDSNTITDNEILDIMVDRSNRIWIATGIGIDRYNRETAKFKSYKINSTNYTINSIFQDIIWICTWGAGLCYFDEDSDSIISLSDTLIRYASISSIAEDLRGNIWLGSENEGLFYMDRNTLKVFSFNSTIEGISSPYYLNNTRIRAICPDQSGNMLIGTYDSGLYKYNASLKKISRLITESELLNSKSRISGILKDDNNKFWISTDGDGVFLYNMQNNTVRDANSDYNFNNPISSKAIRTIFFDNNKTLWLGTYKAGVNYTYDVQRNRFEHFHHDFSKKSIISIEGIDNSMVLIGTDGAGLYTFDESLKKLRSINTSKSNFTEISLCIHKDFENNFWVGSFTEGVIELDSNLNQIRHLSKKTETYSHNDIRSITSDSNYVYIATNYHGLDIYDRKTQTISNYTNNFTYPDSGITFNLLKPLLLDSQGYLWIGSKNGITRFNPTTKEYVNIYSTSEDGQPTSINSIFEDNQGYIWLGTNNGLSKLNSSIWAEKINNKDSIYNRSNYTFTNYELNKKQGSIIVYSILEDQQGNLWLGTNNGLIRFNMKEEYAKFFYSETGVNMKLFNPRSAYKSNNG